MNKYQTYLFDWDGCLMDTLSAVLDSYHLAFKHFGLNLSSEEVINTCYGEWRGPLKLGISEDKYDEFNRILLDDIAQKYPRLQLHLHAKETLEYLKRNGKKVGIVSSGIKSPIVDSLKRFDIQKYIDCLITKEDTIKHKPDPEPILKALNELRAQKQEAVMIGDSNKDILAGQNAGIDSILFYPKNNQPFYEKSELYKLRPTVIIEALKDLLPQ